MSAQKRLCGALLCAAAMQVVCPAGAAPAPGDSDTPMAEIRQASSLRELERSRDALRGADAWLAHRATELAAQSYPSDLEASAQAVQRMGRRGRPADLAGALEALRGLERGFEEALEAADAASEPDSQDQDVQKVLLEHLSRRPRLASEHRNRVSMAAASTGPAGEQQKEQLRHQLEQLDAASFKEQLNHLRAYLDRQQSAVRSEIAQTETAIVRLQAQQAQEAGKQRQQRERQMHIDETLIAYCVPALALFLLGLLAAPRLYRDVRLQREVFTSGLLLELFTVFFITSGILILGLGGKLESSLLGTLLGGISGYVLGRQSGDGSAGRNPRASDAMRMDPPSPPA